MSSKALGSPYTIGIKDYKVETTVGYKEERIFTSDISDLPEGAEIQWFVNGQCTCAGSSCTVKDPTDDYSVQVKLVDKDGIVIAESVLLNVKVKNNLFAKICYFLMTIYSALIGAVGNIVNK